MGEKIAIYSKRLLHATKRALIQSLGNLLHSLELHPLRSDRYMVDLSSHKQLVHLT